MKKSLPSPSGHIDEKKLFQLEKLIPPEKTQKKDTFGLKSKAPRLCPEVALFTQRAKRRMDEDYRRLKV